MLDWIFNLDKSMGDFISLYGAWIYTLLGGIVFAETGLIIFSFLPGDTLLFAAGSYAASGKLNIWLLTLIIIVMACIGNTINLLIAKWIYKQYGDTIFNGRLKWLDEDALKKTQDFYKKHGGKTLVLARFIPVLRTFAPFVAGLSKMSWLQFQLYNIMGAILWGASLLWLGYSFGNIPFIKNNLNIIILCGLCAAVVPTVLGLIYNFFKKKNKNNTI